MEKHREWGKQQTGQTNVNFKRVWTKTQLRNLSEKTAQQWEDGKVKLTGNRYTKPELEMAEVLNNMGIVYQDQYRVDTRWYDFYLPEQNILLEVDGRYWHTTPDGLKRDKIKNRLAKKMGYRLVRVWEDEINREWRVIH
jgi:very-short-patch-repair endonuclease